MIKKETLKKIKQYYYLDVFRMSFPAVQSPCRNNGGCSQLCVLIPYGRRCMCLPGMSIAEDKKTCMLPSAKKVELIHGRLHIPNRTERKANHDFPQTSRDL